MNEFFNFVGQIFWGCELVYNAQTWPGKTHLGAIPSSLWPPNELFELNVNWYFILQSVVLMFLYVEQDVNLA